MTSSRIYTSLICTHSLFMLTHVSCMHGTCDVGAAGFLLHTWNPQVSPSSSHWALLVLLSDFFSFGCGLRHVRCFCLDAHFIAPFFPQRICATFCARWRECALVHGVRQRPTQRQPRGAQRCRSPWPGVLLSTLPGWGVSLGHQFCEIHTQLIVYSCHMNKNLA